MLEPSTEEFRKAVCKELDTTLENVQEEVQSLKDWLTTQPHLPQCSTNTLLTTFIVASKNQPERAKTRIDNYYTARGQLPQFYADRDPLEDRLLEVNREIRFFLLPKRTPDGCRVMMMTLATGDASKYDLTLLSKRIAMMVDIKFHREAFDKGTYFVFNGANYKLSHALRFSPKIAFSILRCLQISVHTEGPEVVENYFPLEMLPQDFGGRESPSEVINEDWLNCLASNRDWLLTEGSLTVEESKRPPPLIVQPTD